MTNEEMKQNIGGFATYVSIAAGSLARDIKFESKESTVEFCYGLRRLARKCFAGSL